MNNKKFIESKSSSSMSYRSEYKSVTVSNVNGKVERVVTEIQSSSPSTSISTTSKHQSTSLFDKEFVSNKPMTSSSLINRSKEIGYKPPYLTSCSETKTTTGTLPILKRPQPPKNILVLPSSSSSSIASSSKQPTSSLFNKEFPNKPMTSSSVLNGNKKTTPIKALPERTTTQPPKNLFVQPSSSFLTTSNQPSTSIFDKEFLPNKPLTNSTLLNRNKEIGYKSPYSSSLCEPKKTTTTKAPPLLNTTTQPPKNLSFLQSTSKSLNKKPQKGYAVVFNQEKFKNDHQKERLGTELDVASLKKVFEKYNIETIVCDNYTLNRIRTKIYNLSKMDFSKYSCFICVILTHGGEKQSLCAYDAIYNLDDDIVNVIATNDTLQNKLKLFLVQACRGSKEMNIIQTDSALRLHNRKKNFTEILKCFATYESFVSFRSSMYGSQFIQNFCEHLERDGHVLDIKTIMENVTKAIVDSNDNAHQVPEVHSTMTKKFYFGR